MNVEPENVNDLETGSLKSTATDDAACAAVRWAVREATGPVYIRLVSVPWELPFEPEPVERLDPGRGRVVREGSAGFFVTTGPVMLSRSVCSGVSQGRPLPPPVAARTASGSNASARARRQGSAQRV